MHGRNTGGWLAGSAPPAGWAPALLVAGFQIAAYLAIMLPMPFGFNRFASLALVKYQLITASNALAGPILLLAILHLIRSRLLAMALHLAQAAVLIGSSIYIRYFEALPHISALRQAGNLPAVARQVLLQLIGPREVVAAALLAGSCVTCVILVGRERGRRRSRHFLAALALAAACLMGKDLLLQSRLPLWKYRFDGVYFLKRFGFLPILASQVAGELGHRPRVVAWPGVLNADNRPGPAFPPSFPNIFIVQVESLDPWAIDHEVEGKAVMPFLRNLKRRSLFFANFFAQHRGGGSSDAELALLTGLIPLGSHSGFITADFARITGLPRVLGGFGYYSCALHANAGSFYYRRPAFRALGFDRFNARDSFTGEAAGWFSRDEAFFAQSLDLLDRVRQPFFAYLITMQSHGPFDNHRSPAETFDFAPGERRILRDYLLVMHEVDRALQVLITGIERRGWLAGGIVAIFSDHQSGVGPDSLGFAGNVSLGQARIPLLVLAPALEAGTFSKVGSTLDLGPTLLHLLGANTAPGTMGRSLLDPGVGRAVVEIEGALAIVRNADAGSAAVVVERDLAPWTPFIEYSESVLHP